MSRNIFLLILFSLLLATCSTTSSPTQILNPNADIRAQLSAWNAGNAELASFFYAEAEAKVVKGKILASGEFALELEPNVATNLLEPVVSCSGLQVSNPAARTNAFSAVDVTATEDLGLLALASSEQVVLEGLRVVGDYYVQFIYADQAVSLKGDCPLGGLPGVFRYDLDLKVGWNTSLFSLVSKQGGQEVLELSSQALPAGATWFLGH